MNTSDETIDFLAIGDIVIDAFIKLDTNSAHIEVEKHEKELCMPWGTKLPYERVDVIPAVGNAPNAGVSAARLGLTTGLMSHVGKDDWGEECLGALSQEHILLDYMTSEDKKQTNYHYVLRLGAERTILIKHDTFTYNLERQTAGKPIPRWVYFSSVGEHGLPYHHEIAQWIKKNNIKLAFQPGTFQISLGYEQLKDVYEVAELFFCNVEEARSILSPVIGESVKTAEIEKLLKEMRSLGPNIVCITDGSNGAYAYDGEHAWFMPIYPDPAPPVDRTGAGDSFSSTFTSALALGHDIPTALSWGPINSMSVVQYVGAQEGLLSLQKLQEYLMKAPEDYTIQQLF